MSRKLAIGSDHAGYELKEFLKKNVPGVTWLDQGPANSDRTDYPDYAEKVARLVSSGELEAGVLVCGSGIGMCITANKFPGVRAAVVESVQTALLSRQHNDANVLCLGARILPAELAKSIVETWLNTAFEGGRHADRLKKITDLEKRNAKHPSSGSASKK